ASKTVTMTNPTGLHTRPGGVFVAKAKEFESTVEVENEGKKVKLCRLQIGRNVPKSKVVI
ncbi:MAG: HPr family phosphocarrier protein, partial [Aggregatibacter sp.]